MRKNSLILTLLFFSFSSIAFAFVAPHRHHSKHGHSNLPIQQKVLRPNLIKSSSTIELGNAYRVDSVKIDALSGEPRLLTGDFGSVQKSHTQLHHYVEHSLSFIKNNLEIFKVTPKSLRLIPGSVHLGENVQLIQFAVFKDGLVIEDASISFRFKKKKLIQVQNQSFGEALPEKHLEYLPESIERGLVEKMGAVKTNKLSESFRIEKDGKNYVRKKIATYTLVDGDKLPLTVQVDTASNKVFQVKEDKFYLEGNVSAKIYPRWYDEELTDTGMPLLDVKEDPSADLTARSDWEGLLSINDLSTRVYADNINGQYVKIKNLSGADAEGEGVKESDFWSLKLKAGTNTTASSDRVAAQYMVYYHTTEMVGHALQYTHSSWFDAPLVANTNLRSTCNAHWDGSTINLYSGDERCANTGLISDVIYHEWGHGLDANTGGIQDSAFSEGIGDIMSLIMTRSHLLGIGFMLQDGSPVRNLAPDKIYPRDQGEVHDEGLIIGSTFWDLFEAFSKKYDADRAVDILSRYMFEGIYTARTYLDMYDAILVIDDDDSNLENGTPNSCLVNKVFSQHGLAESLSWCTLATIQEPKLQDENENGIFEPGEKVELSLAAFNPGMEPLENLMGTVSHDGDSVDLLDSDLFWDAIASESSAESSDTASFMIRDDITCGSTVDLGIRLAADTREVFSNISFTVGKNDGTAETLGASNLPQPITDYSVTESPVTVQSEQWEDGIMIQQAVLNFDITHSYIGDVSVEMVSPEGESIQVFRGQGSGQNVSFSEDITEKVSHLRTIKGTWTLKVSDNAFRDEGSLESFSLTLTPKRFSCEVL